MRNKDLTKLIQNISFRNRIFLFSKSQFADNFATKIMVVLLNSTKMEKIYTERRTLFHQNLQNSENSPTKKILKATGLNTEIMKGSNKSKNSARTKSIIGLHRICKYRSKITVGVKLGTSVVLSM